MQRSFVFAVVAVLLTACAGPRKNTGVYPTFIPIGTMLAAAAPTPTPLPASLILTDFPLAVGTVWTYSGQISYEDPNGSEQTGTWSGTITDAVLEQTMMPDGSVVFKLQETLDPPPPPVDFVWRQPGTYEYTVRGDGIFSGDTKVLQLPLADHLTWDWQAGYEMSADAIGDVVTPYGGLKGCYTITLETNPDTTIDTFCPGIGYVKHSYAHHGSLQNEEFVLQSYQPAQ